MAYKYLFLNSSGVIKGIPNFFASDALPVSSSIFLTRTTKVFFETLEPSLAPTFFIFCCNSSSLNPVMTIDFPYNG